MDLYLKSMHELISLLLLHVIYENRLNDEIKIYVDHYDHMEYLEHDVDHLNLKSKNIIFKRILFITHLP